MVFNVYVYIFDDYPRNFCSYIIAGFDQAKERDEGYVERFSGDPVWTGWLRTLQATWPILNGIKKVWTEWCPEAGSYFPHPGKMVNSSFRGQWKHADSLEFLEYLDAQYYGELSSSAHGQWMGLHAAVTQVLRIESKDTEQEEFALKEKSDLTVQQLRFLMCLVTELLTSGGLEGADRAAFLWTLLSGYSGWAKEIYEMRYQAKLSC